MSNKSFKKSNTIWSLEYKEAFGESFKSDWLCVMLRFQRKKDISWKKLVINLFFLAIALCQKAISCIIWKLEKFLLAKICCLEKNKNRIGNKEKLKMIVIQLMI